MIIDSVAFHKILRKSMEIIIRLYVSLSFFTIMMLTHICAVSAEIALEGAPIHRDTEREELGEPEYDPIMLCKDVSKEHLSKNFVIYTNEFFLKYGNVSISDLSDFSEILIIEDCRDFFVISTVLGHTTFGRITRIILPRDQFEILKSGTTLPDRYLVVSSH